MATKHVHMPPRRPSADSSLFKLTAADTTNESYEADCSRMIASEDHRGDTTPNRFMQRRYEYSSVKINTAAALLILYDGCIGYRSSTIVRATRLQGYPRCVGANGTGLLYCCSIARVAFCCFRASVLSGGRVPMLRHAVDV